MMKTVFFLLLGFAYFAELQAFQASFSINDVDGKLTLVGHQPTGRYAYSLSK